MMIECLLIRRILRTLVNLSLDQLPSITSTLAVVHLGSSKFLGVLLSSTVGGSRYAFRTTISNAPAHTLNAIMGEFEFDTQDTPPHSLMS
nr:MAG TPA: hypothetical protein [Siphoviridae sp. ctBmJ1]